MNTVCCLLISALTTGQPTSRSEWQLAPQLTSGLELVYRGSFVEESLIPNVQFQRQYRLETLVFVMDAAGRHWNVAFMTTLTPHDARMEPAARPSSVRLEIAPVDAQGRLLEGQRPPLLPPLDGPPLLETGCLVELPNQALRKGTGWDVSEADRPPRSWQVHGLDTAGGLTCVKIVGQQQSLDWDRPRADQTAWRRQDTIWIHPSLGLAQRVERLIERRDPARREPTHRLVATYELESRLRYPGRLHEDRKQEILKAKKFHDDASALLRQPAQYRPQLETLLKKVSLHLDSQAPTPYRKAVFHLAGWLDSARRGETPADLVTEEPASPRTAVGIGQRVPDFVISDIAGKDSVRLSRLLGRPLLVVFYNPSTDLGREVMLFARELLAKHGDQRVTIMALAVTSSPAAALKQQRDLQLPFGILDGQGMHLTFGVETTPRLVLLDGDGIVRSTHTGWGGHVPREIQDELQRWLPGAR